MENYHIWLGKKILGVCWNCFGNRIYFDRSNFLQNFDLFKEFTPDEYKEFMVIFEKFIIYTDLSVAIKPVCSQDKEFFKEHLTSLLATAGDFSGICKEPETARRICFNLMEEFYNQGDKMKEMGYNPILHFNRDEMDKVPEQQIKYLEVLVVPVYESLSEYLPNTIRLLQLAQYVFRIIAILNNY